MSKKNKKKVVFLDRDGVINHDPGDYTTSLQEFTILPGVIEALKRFTESGYGIVVITNQGGIAKGKYTLDDFKQINDYMSLLFVEAGIDFVDTYFCPHHESKSRCLCRKPGSAMLEKAIARHSIDVHRSFMIGDKQRDIEAASNAGVRGIKSEVNQDLRTLDYQTVLPDFTKTEPFQ